MVPDYKWSINNYINDEYSVCREERQYALYLNNIITAYGNPEKRKKNDSVKRIFSLCGIPKNAYVDRVFYEVTLMRDIFERSRRVFLGQRVKNKEVFLQDDFTPSNKIIEDKEYSFNRALLSFCMMKIDQKYKKNCTNHERDELLDKIVIKEKSFSNGRIPPIEGYNPKDLKIAQAMMNAKPDVGLVYLDKAAGDGKKKLLFIECKYESDEQKYKIGNLGLTQSKLQGYIAEFLCGSKYLPDIEMAEVMKEETASKMVVLSRKQDRDGQQETIWIKDLIRFNDEILCGKR